MCFVCVCIYSLLVVSVQNTKPKVSVSIMSFLFLVAFTLISAFLLSKYLSRPRTRSTLPGGSLGYPLIGETLSFLRAQREDRGPEWLEERISKHGSVFKTSILGSRTVVIIGQAGNKFVLGADDDVLAAKQPLTLQTIGGKQNILELTGYRYTKTPLGICVYIYMI